MILSSLALSLAVGQATLATTERDLRGPIDMWSLKSVERAATASRKNLAAKRILGLLKSGEEAALKKRGS